MEQAEQIACTRCGDFVARDNATYSPDGDLVCRACEAVAAIDEGDNRAAKTVLGTAGGAFFLGLLSLVFNPCLLASIGAGLSALSAFRLLMDDNLRRRMGWAVAPTVLLAIAALCLGPGVVILRMLGVAVLMAQ